MHDEVVLTKVLRQDRAIVIAGAAAISVLGWSYLVYEGWAMQHMDLASVAMPSTGVWGLADLLMIFAMWTIMMIAMMVPSVTPLLLTFATINRSRHAQGRVFVSAWVFLAGYVASWTGFSFVATLAQWGLHNLELISPMMVGTSPVLGSLVLASAHFGRHLWPHYTKRKKSYAKLEIPRSNLQPAQRMRRKRGGRKQCIRSTSCRQKGALMKFYDVALAQGVHERAYRGRDIHCWMPPAQIPAGVIHAPGSHLG